MDRGRCELQGHREIYRKRERGIWCRVREREWGSEDGGGWKRMSRRGARNEGGAGQVLGEVEGVEA